MQLSIIVAFVSLFWRLQDEKEKTNWRQQRNTDNPIVT